MNKFIIITFTNNLISLSFHFLYFFLKVLTKIKVIYNKILSNMYNLAFDKNFNMTIFIS